MKRGTPDHPKTRMLQSKLGVKRWEAVGILESLWHFAAQYAKRGDIGKWSNEEIAAAIEWEGNPDELVAALVASKYLDESSEFRLLVHDWETHADQTVARADEVKKLGFAKEKLANPSIIPANASQPCQCQSHKPEPVPAAAPKPAHVLDFSRMSIPKGWDNGELREICQRWVDHRASLPKPPLDNELALTEAFRLFKTRAAFVHNVRLALTNGWQNIRTSEEPPNEPTQSHGLKQFK